MTQKDIAELADIAASMKAEIRSIIARESKERRMTCSALLGCMAAKISDFEQAQSAAASIARTHPRHVIALMLVAYADSIIDSEKAAIASRQ